MGKRATMVDIADKAGVSQATVSLVLNNAPNVRVSEETRKRVKAFASELGYRKGPAHALLASSARVIGLMIDEVTTTPFAAPLIEGARDEAAQHDCIVATFCTGGDPELEAAALEVLSSLRLVGILYSTLITQTVKPPARLMQIPSILLNCRDKSRQLPSVVPADLTGAYEATMRLAQAGHRRIAHIPGERWGDAALDRVKGYREALASNDVVFDPALVSDPAWTVDSGRAATLSLLGLPDPPTAFFCFNDRAAIGCYEALHVKGLSVPQDVSVIGFDDEDLVAHLLPPLTTMVLPHDEMARWAVNELIRLEGKAWPPAHPRRVKTECALVERQSVGSAPELKRGSIGLHQKL
ncbi:MAG: LacI family DNA-binding transcriptional regulator [Rhizobiaceae bacterium]